MKLSDGTILMHDNKPYDPVKAHEYYIRTRQLKGRRPAQSILSKPRNPNPLLVTRSPTFTVSLKSGKKIKLTQQQLAEQQAYAAKRVNEIKQRLVELSTKLNKMLVDAKKSPTAADKSKAARNAKQYRQKHRQELKSKAKRARSKKTTTRRDSVKELEGRIAVVKNRLKAAVETQRALSSATKNLH